MRHVLGARFNAELESVYERAFTYVVGEMAHAYYALVSAPLNSESADTDRVNGSNIISLRSKMRQSEGSRARAARRQFPIGSLQCTKARPRSRSSDAAVLAKTH